MSLRLSTLLVTATGALAACTTSEPPPSGCAVEDRAGWIAPAWDVSAAEALALRAGLDDLIGASAMRGAEDGSIVLSDASALQAMFGAGTPSLEGVTSPAFRAVVGDAFAEFAESIAAGRQTLVSPDGQWQPGDAGGIMGSSFRGINEGGLELRQLVDKGLFGGGAFYAYALGLTEGEITPATIEAIAAVMGHNAELTGGDDVLVDSARYAYLQGYHVDTIAALTAAHTYAQDADCTAERDAALMEVFRLWEKGLFARFSHYVSGAAAAVAAANSEDERADALHDLSEGVGLALGFRGLTDPALGPLAGAGRLVTDTVIDSMMESLGVHVDDLGASTTGELLIETNFGAPITVVESKLGEALDLPAGEVVGWRAPSEG